MKFIQKEIRLSPRPRGFHLITDDIVSAIPELNDIIIGQCQVFIQHTSAGLTLNENAEPTVRADFESHFDKMVPENAPYYKHTLEGPDDMPAHIKASLLGSSVTIPVTSGRLALGLWQGIYLCEHRDKGGIRKLVVSLWGQ